MIRRTLPLSFVAFIVACGTSTDPAPGGATTGHGDATSVPDGSTGTTGGAEDGAGGGTGDASGGGPRWVRPSGAIALRFFADDRANQTYADGQIRWTGSFAWDPATNVISPESAWLPDSREWPALFDDGPIDQGGHEAAGAVAGDRIFTTEVYFVPGDAETTFEYGALNEFLRWIWVGPNGLVTVAAGATEDIEAGGVTFPKFGQFDVKLTLDLAGLHPDYVGTIGAETHRIYVKGTMNSWTPIQLLDNGKTGDDAAGDGVFTYAHSTKLGPHDGLVQAGLPVQFVFVFAFPGDDPDDGLEYLGPPDALVEGVRAYAGRNGVWTEQTVTLEPDSYGKVKNTTITVAPECSAEAPCAGAQICDGGACVAGCSDAAPCAEGFECAGGQCVVASGCSAAAPCDTGFDCQGGHCVPSSACSVEKPCGDGFVCEGGQCVAEPACSQTKPCSDGLVCVSGSCVQDAGCSDQKPCEAGYVCTSGACVLAGGAPSVSVVDPDHGAATGGTPVTISGNGFDAGATVRFGQASATAVKVLGPGTLTCVTPPGSPGKADVVVRNPDGVEGAYPGGFTYQEKPAPTVDGVDPAGGDVAGGMSVTLTGTGFQPGATVRFGVKSATDVSVKGPTLATCVAPAADAAGMVDVTLTNPDGQSASSLQGFLYAPGLVDYAALEAPFDLTAMAGQVPGKVRARVYEPGVTEAEGAGADLLAELGWRSADAGSEWTFVAATWVGQGGDFQNDDVFEAALPNDLAAGSWLWTFRFSVGGETWVMADRDGPPFSEGAAGTLTVQAPPEGLAVLAVSPGYAPLAGGTEVVITGQEMGADTAVFFGAAEAASVTVESATTVRAVAPAGVAGPVTLTVKSAGKEASWATPFHFALVGTPALDGVVGADWPAGSQLADDTGTLGWDNNHLNRLWAVFNGTDLFVGVEGAVEAGNTLVVYLDVDYGSGTGVGPAGVLDNATFQDLDDALSAGAPELAGVPSGFGAEFGAGAVGGVGVISPMLDANAGLRGLANPTDLGWLPADVAWGAGGAELRLPLSSLGLSPVPGGRTVALFVRIVSRDGAFVSPEGLPSSGAGDGSVDQVVTLWVP